MGEAVDSADADVGVGLSTASEVDGATGGEVWMVTEPVMVEVASDTWALTTWERASAASGRPA